MQNSEKTNEWINWIEEAIDKKHIKNYEYENFKNIQEIGSGAFGKVFRANWKSFDHYLALKSFYDLNKITLKEIVNEINLQRDVDFHNNIIRFYGITKHASENIFNPTKDYLLVMEYADGGTLRDYLKNNFHRLTWNDKYNLASQLARSILCLHEEGIIHRDLHSCNVLVHQDSIKLADFCLSKRIGEASKSQTKLLGMVSYIDPKVLTDNNLKSNEKSDIYSIGVLLWEISSGKPPFHEENYDFSLMYKISQGRREEIISGTPDDYSNLYTECWNGELNNRPTIHEVVDRLKNFTPRSKRRRYEYLTPDSLENSLHEDLSQMIHDFDNKNSDEINNMTSTNKINENILSEKDLIMIINEINDLILEKLKKGDATKNYVLDHLKNNNIKSKEIYKWLLNNQNNNPNSIFLLGYFNFYGIVTNENEIKAFDLFINASEDDHILAQYCIGECYEYGSGIIKNDELAFEYYEKVANKDYSIGQFKLGWFYNKGKNVKKDYKLAAYWYEKAANNGHFIAMQNLGLLYKKGDGVEEDHKKAFELYKKSAEGEYLDGIMMLAYCYSNGIGINIDKQKAVELYQKAANMGHKIAQYNLALMYENGEGIEKDINQAIYFYKQSAKQRFKKAQNKLKVLRELKDNS